MRWMAGLAAVIVLAACSSAPGATGPARICGPTTCVDPALFARALRTELDGHVVGYVALVSDQRVAGGHARTAADPPALPMSAQVPANLASIGKMFTAVALLRTLADRDLAVDDPIAPYLPRGWKKGDNVSTLTFRALLGHRSGVRYESSYAWSSQRAARDAIAEGVDLVPASAPGDYNNLNYTLIRDLLPRLLGRSAPGPAAADRMFTAWVDEEVLRPSGVSGDVRCGPAVTGDMLIYPSVSSLSAQDHGVPPRELGFGCSAGGQVMSSASALAVLKTLQAGRLLTAEERTLMDDGCLGWDCAIGEQKNFRGKSGGLGEGAATLQTMAGVVAGTLPFVAVVNSAVPTGTSSVGGGLGQAVARAAASSTTQR